MLSLRKKMLLAGKAPITDPTFIALQTGTSSLTTTAPRVGDLLIVATNRYGGSTAATLPSGWTNITAVTDSNSTASFRRVAYKYATTTNAEISNWGAVDSTSCFIFRNIKSIGANSTRVSPVASTASGFNAITGFVSGSYVLGLNYGPIATPPTGLPIIAPAACFSGAPIASFNAARNFTQSNGTVIAIAVELKV